MRILFTTHSPPSHFFPLQPLAVAARAAGHKVAFAAASDLASLIQSQDFTYFPAGANMRDPDILAALEATHGLRLEEKAEQVTTKVFGGVLAERYIPGLSTAFERFQPDIVVSETTELVGPLLAERHGKTAAIVLFGLLPAPDRDQRRLLASIAALRARLELDPTRVREGLERRLTLVFASRSYQPKQAEIRPGTMFFRPSPLEPKPGEVLPPWFAQLDDRPIVYGSLGTVPLFNGRPGALRMVIDAIGACDVNGIVTCGHNQDPASFGPLPSNVHVERFIPQALVLKHCRAMIGHGGYGTTTGALSFGIPLVITPLGADQPLHAMRCRELGVAEVLMPGEVTLSALTSALMRVLHEPRYAQRARELRAELDALPDVSAAVAELVAWRGAPR